MRAVSLSAPPGVGRYQLTDRGATLSWRQVLDAWKASPEFTDAFCDLLAGSPFLAFRWETPALVSSALDEPFEFVTVEARSLDRRPDIDTFAEHYSQTNAAVTFPSLGGSSTLIAPCPRTGRDDFAHLAAFVRSATPTQRHALWAEVSAAVNERVGSTPIWLSTAGDAVAWLHVRIDRRPKYYSYHPYRHRPGSNEPGVTRQ